MERRLHLSTETAGVYLSWQGTGFDDYPKADPSNGGRVQREFAGAERAATSMAARSVKRGRGVVRGRTAIAIGLGAFLVVTTSVVWRRAQGSAAAAELHDLGAQRDELQAQRAKLEGEVRRASSQVQLAPRVQRLGMRVPSDSQVIDLPDPVRR